MSEKPVAYCESVGVDAYIVVPKKDIDSQVFPPTTSARHARFAMQAKLTAANGAEIYARRKVIVEPVSGRSNKRWA